MLALPLIHAYSLGAGVTPVQKVIAMLQDMRSKGVAEKQDEQVRFAAFKEFCENTAAEKKASIEEAEEQIEQLQADIQKAESDAANLAVDIEKLDKDIATWGKEKETATAIRKKEKEDFAKTHKDYTESLDQLDRAIIALKAADIDRPQAEMLLQKVANLNQVPVKARRVLASYLAMDDTVAHKQTPKGYEFQGEGVLAMLGDMKAKFEDERMQLEKDEMGAEHAYKLVMMELTNSIATAEKTRSEKAKLKASREEAAAAAKGDLADTVASRDEDKAYLAALEAQCSQKSTDFAARQQLRGEELEAIDKAIEIVASPELSGAADKHITGGYSAGSLLLRGAETEAHPVAQKQVAAFLQAQAVKLDSHVLSVLSLRVGENPFANVKKLIEDMIQKLLEEASEESDHKGWCDTEMVKNKQTREAKTDDIDAMHAKNDKLEATINTLAQEIADLEASVAEISKAVAEALEVRAEETKKNKATVEDCGAAQTATSQALAVLKTFYDKAGTATALVQQPKIDAPPTFDKPYTGMAGGGVMGLLEVIASDFARLEAETETAEEEASRAHTRFMAESSKDKAVKAADLDHKKKSKVEAESDLSDTISDLKGTETELDAALVYYEKLKPSCQDKVVTFDDRVSQRKDEIAALKEALTILSA